MSSSATDVETDVSHNLTVSAKVNFETDLVHQLDAGLRFLNQDNPQAGRILLYHLGMIVHLGTIRLIMSHQIRLHFPTRPSGLNPAQANIQGIP